MLDHAQTTALKIVESELSMELLTQLHNRRLEAAGDTITLSLHGAARSLSDDDVTDEENKHVRSEVIAPVLKHEWLPRMSDLRMVEYDADEQVITATHGTTLQ